MSEMKFLNNKEKNRYELHVGEYFSLVKYKINKEGVVHMIHTETPPELKGQGVASVLIEKSLQDIKEQGRKVYPLCPFVKTYIQKHPEWKEIVK